MEDNKKIALFIDAENMNNRFAEKIINEASSYGSIIIKRIFADWSNPAVSSWKKNVAEFSLLAEQQFSLVSGKGSSDIALVINAMMVLFEKDIDVFCLASSDSDFTRLVQELRERGKLVVGFGEKKTNQSFINAFSEFIYIDEKLEETEEINSKTKATTKKAGKPKVQESKIKIDKNKKKALIEIIETLVENKGKALYSEISIDMKNKYPNFIPRNYGFRSMKPLIEALVKENVLKDYKIKTEKDNTTLSLVSKNDSKLK